MKNAFVKALAMLALAMMGSSAFGYAKSMYPYEQKGQGGAMGCTIAQPGMELELGKWYTNFQVCKKYADDNGIPLFAVWSNHSCIHCWFTDAVFIQDSFKEWQAANAPGQVICCYMAGGDDVYDQVNSSAYNWMWTGGSSTLASYPFVCFWWKAKGINVHMTGDDLCRGSGNTNLSFMDNTFPQRVENTIWNFNKYFGAWQPLKYAGGSFAEGDSAGDRLEFEDGTESVTFNLVREGRAVEIATNVTCTVKGPKGEEVLTTNVVWAAGADKTAVTLAIPEGVCTKDGEQLTLTLTDNGKEEGQLHITYVQRETSAANPKWIGEDFDFGEWTCDLDAAKAKVAATDGAAYTLVSVQGSMWCPDCANTDRNFLDLKDGEVNRFSKWAKDHNVALVSMDIPNYNGPTVTNCATPTLFSKTAYATTLARAKEYPASGADASLTNAVKRSGLGYLTRKGATDAEAEMLLKKYHDLAYNNTDNGGFHRPEDGNKNRTGVPIFVLLRKDGTVAARFTRLASVSPMKADQANFANYLKRFEEMLTIAEQDATEIANNYPGAGAIPLVANGGKASGELCNADFQDAFKLTGMGGNAVQSVTVKGTTTAEVTVQFYKGTEALGTATKGKLSDGVTIEREFTESGDYYVLVKGKDITAAEFKAESATANNFHAFEITGTTVLVPQGNRAEAKAPAGSEFVTVVLVEGEKYCFSGVDAAANAAALELTATEGPYSFFTAKQGGKQQLKISTGEGGTVFYQVWCPGMVAMTELERSVSESVNDLNDDYVEMFVARLGGSSGRVKARVSLDAEASDLEAERFEPFAPVDFVWEDGDASNRTFKVKILDDNFFIGSKQLVFKLEVLASDAGDVIVKEAADVFTLKVIEDDEARPGRGLVTRTEPAAVKGKTVYVKASEGAKIYAKRIEHCDGLAGLELKSSVTGTVYTAVNPRDLEVVEGKQIFWWASREDDEKYVQVTGIPAGQRATITFSTYLDFEAVRGSNTVTVVAVADDAPAFREATAAFSPYRYVVANPMTVELDRSSVTAGSEKRFTKISGTLPSGLKAAYDEESEALVFTGTTTAKAGTYVVDYQVSEKRDSKWVAGLTTQVTFTIVDPTDMKTNPASANPHVGKVRTIKDLAVVNSVNGVLAGVLQVTIPTRGNVSAKYVCESGTIALSASSWSEYDPEDRRLTATLANAKLGFEMTFSIDGKNMVDVSISDPNYEGVSLDAHDYGNVWSKDNSAESWKGYYTVALPVEAVLESETENLAPKGCGYLTLKLDTASAVNAGKVTWAGMLPNGTAVSGSAVLGVDATTATLPIFKISGTDTLSAYLQVQPDAATLVDRRSVQAVEGVKAIWSHGERSTSTADYLLKLGVYGAIYDKTENLGGCCEEYFQTTQLQFAFDASQLGAIALGTPGAITPVTVKVGADNLKIVSETNPSNITLSFNRATGIVSGRANLPYTTAGGAQKTLTVNYKGVILNGWGEGCGCGDFEVYRPFFNGSFYFTDKVSYPSGNATRTLSVKRGGDASMK